MPTTDAKPKRSRRSKRSSALSTNVTRFLQAMDIHANDAEVFRTALTHRSSAGDRWRDEVDGPATTSNERLEFYGDAILGAVVAEYLYHRFPDATEGTLTRRRSALVRAEQLTAWARELRLEDYLYLAQSERIAEGGKDRLLAGAFEAMIGAIVIDQGSDYVVKFIHDLLDRDVDRVLAGVKFANPKGQLQELTQNRHQSAPSYHIISMVGPAHQRIFEVEVRFHDVPLATGTGASKRAAEEAAATEALRLIRTQGPKMLDGMVSGQLDEPVGE
jgi:ribonuclease-3